MRFILVCALSFYFSPGRAMAQRPLGLDVSHYQGSINWTSVKSAGYSFAWAKATEGGSGSGDAFFASNISGAKAAGVYVGAYHFAHPEANSPATEANFFWSVAGSSITNDGLSVQPMLDYETFTAPGNIPVGAASYSDWANQWCNTIVNKAAAVGVLVKPILPLARPAILIPV
jgi:GH25 family lysozyme M1 (1,4-beta-N-acetylmuramidase)